MQLKNKVIMDRSSRPGPEDIGHFSSLFTYFEVAIPLLRSSAPI